MNIYKTHIFGSKKVLLAIGLLLGMVILSQAPIAQALSINDSGLPNYPIYRAHTDPGHFGRCENGAVRAIRLWPSRQNQSTEDLQQTPLLIGTATSASLQFNFLGHNCTRNIAPESSTSTDGSLIDTNTRKSKSLIVGSSATNGAVITGNPDGKSTVLNWDNNYNNFYVKSSSDGVEKIDFGLSNLSAGNYIVTVTFRVKSAVEYTPGAHAPSGGAQYACVNPETKPLINLNDSQVSTCNETLVSFSIEVKTASFTVQGYRTFGSGVGAAFPNGTGGTSFNGTRYADNPYNRPFNSNVTVTSDASISYNGSTYNRAGYTLCYNSTSCHSGARNTGSSVSIDLSSQGGYADIYWHYETSAPPPPPPPAATTCPEAPAWNNLIRTVNLPASGKPNNTYSTPVVTPNSTSTSNGSASTSTSTSGNTQTRTQTRTVTETRQGTRVYTYYNYRYDSSGNLVTDVLSVVDINWSGETTPYTESNGKAVLNYQPHFDNYPYDIHSPRITYRVGYEERKVTERGQQTRTRTQKRTQTRTRANALSPWGPWGNYSQWNYTGSWSGWSNWGSWSTVSGTDQHVAYHLTGNQTVNAPVMPYCYLRRFTVDSGNPTLTDARFNDLEDPTAITFGSQINGRFDYTNRTPLGLRQPMRASNFPLGGSYRVRKWNGAVQNLPAPSLGKTGGNIPGNYTFTGGFGPGNISRGFTDTFNAGVPPLQPGDRPCFSTNTPQSSVTVDPDGNIKQVLSGNQNSVPSERCGQPLHNKPYLKVYGGSVWAGSAFQDANGNCSNSNQNAQIRTFARFNGGNSFGSSAQYATAAASAIAGNGTDSGFFSASQRSGNTGYLTFANSGFSGSDWGGSFGGTRCLPDFFDANYKSTRFPAGSPNVQTINSATLSLRNLQTNRQYIRTGNLTIGADTTRIRATIYVDGDVTISGNIAYPANHGSYNPDTIPYLTIIARGNIYISSSVNLISGLYIAQPTAAGTKGEIYTCSNGSAPFAANQLFGNCSGTPTAAAMQANCNGGSGITPPGSPLVVHGAFVARKVRFLRTNASLRCAKPARVGYPQPITSPVAAEIFHTAPELYLGYPVFRNRTGQSSNDYGDVMSYTILPPIL